MYRITKIANIEQKDQQLARSTSYFRSLMPLLKQGPADIYIYIYIYICATPSVDAEVQGVDLSVPDGSGEEEFPPGWGETTPVALPQRRAEAMGSSSAAALPSASPPRGRASGSAPQVRRGSAPPPPSGARSRSHSLSGDRRGRSEADMFLEGGSRYFPQSAERQGLGDL